MIVATGMHESIGHTTSMISATVHLKEDHYQYLAERAAATQRSVEDLLSEMLEADIAWRQTLANDPIAQLFGSVSDDSDVGDHIDDIVFVRPPL